MMSRRRIVLFGSALVAATGMPAVFSWRGALPGGNLIDLALKKISGMVSHNHSAAVVGKKYLEATGGSLDTWPLLDDFCTALGRPLRWIAYSDVSTIKELAARQIVDDFSRFDIQRVDGWILSMTEVKLYALLASVQQRQSTS